MATFTAETIDSKPGSAQPVGYGSIISLRKSGFGFIRPVGSSLDLFFHFSQLSKDLNASQLTVGQPLCYTLGTDVKTGRPCACDVRAASQDEVQHEVVSDEQFLGRVIQWPHDLNEAGLLAGLSRSDPGILRYIDVNGHVAHLTFSATDVQLPLGPVYSSTPQSTAQQTGHVSNRAAALDGTQSVDQHTRPHAEAHINTQAYGANTQAGSAAAAAAGAGAGQGVCAVGQHLQQLDTPWVLFRLCQRNTGLSTANQVASTAVARCGAREGFRAVELQPVQHVDSLPPEYKPQLTLLDVLADLHPR